MKNRILSMLLSLALMICMVSIAITQVYATYEEAWLWPVEESKTISSNFGMRDKEGNGIYTFHSGIDIYCPIGSAVRATKSGKIYQTCFDFGTQEHVSSSDMTSYGNYVAIKHTDGTYSLYAHLKQQEIVKVGDSVTQGDVIAYTGDSGNSGGPHCHFQATKTPEHNWSNKTYLINTMPAESCIQELGLIVNNEYVEANGCSTERMTYIWTTCENDHNSVKQRDGSFTYKTIQKSDGTFVAVCQKCGIEYPITLDRSVAGKYHVTQDIILNSAPYADAQNGIKARKNSEYTVIGSTINAYGSLWYETEEGYWIYQNYLNYVSGIASLSIAEGTYYIEAYCGKTVEVENSGKSNKANVQLWENVGIDCQKFVVSKTGDYYILSAVHSGKVIDIADGSSKSGTNIWQYTANGTDAQKWQFEDAGDGYYYIRSALGTYMDVESNGTVNGTNIWAYKFNGNNAQKFRLRSLSELCDHSVGYKTIKKSDGTYAAVCKDCGAEYPITAESNTAGIYKVKQDIILCSAPYREAQTGTKAKKNEEQTVIGSTINAYGNLWYKTSEGYWIYKDYLTYVSPVPASSGGVGTVNIAEGTYYIEAYCGKVIDVQGKGKDNKTNIQIWENAGNDNQKFNITKSGDYYILEAVHSGKVIDVADGSSKSGTNIWQYGANGTDAQKWQFEDAGDGYYYIRSALGTYMDVKNGSTENGANVWAYEFNGSSAQKFRLVSVSASIPHEDADILADDIVAVAQSLIGQYPYVRGGESPEEGGFDCTGLVYYIYHTKLGMSMTLEQARSKPELLALGTKISDISDLLPGDVLQMEYSTGPHVVIYIGNNQIIEAAKPGTMIRQQSFSNISSGFSYGIRFPQVKQNGQADPDYKAEEPAPTNLKAYTDKETYHLGETVHFTLTATNAAKYALSVWDGGASGEGNNVYYSGYSSTGIIEFTPTATGKYGVLYLAKNGDSHITIAGTFEVVEAEEPALYAARPYDGVNTRRTYDSLIVFNQPGAVVSTNVYGTEIAVDAAGRVTAIRKYGDSNQLVVPEGGFVLSGHRGWSEENGEATGGAVFVDTIIRLPDCRVYVDQQEGLVKVFAGSKISGPVYYYLNIGTTMEGAARSGLDAYGCFDVYINGILDVQGVSAYNRNWPLGTDYEIRNIQAKKGLRYASSSDGGSINGTINGYEDVLLSFCTEKSVDGISLPRINNYVQGQFSDVPDNQWYTGSVADAYAYGLMKGNSDTTFNPYGNVTLAEAITMAARIHCIYENGYENFVQSGKWYQVYLDYAYQNGIIGSAYYSADVTQNATRAQFAEIFARALPEEALGAINSIQDSAIPDVPMSVDYANAVYRLYRAGILTGSDLSGSFFPDTFITRAEAAAIVSRMAEPDNRKEFTLSPGHDA